MTRRIIFYCSNKTYLEDDLFSEAENEAFHNSVKNEKPYRLPEHNEVDKDSLEIIRGERDDG